MKLSTTICFADFWLFLNAKAKNVLKLYFLWRDKRCLKLKI